MSKAAKITIAEVEEIVEIGEIPEDAVHVPAIYVDRVVLGEKYEKRIEVGSYTYNSAATTHKRYLLTNVQYLVPV